MRFTGGCGILLVLFGLPASPASVPGISNFDKVSDHVYRGAQPTQAGFQYLAKAGIKTVLDLRESGARGVAEEQSVVGAGMQYVNVPMTGLTAPTPAEIQRILALLEDDAKG